MGTDKVVFDVAGERLVDRVVRRMAPVADAMVVATGPVRSLDVVSPGPRLAEVADPGEGPLGAVAAALSVVETPAVALVACDQPWASPAVMVALLSQLEADVDAVVPVVDGHRQVLHGVYRTAWLAARIDAGDRSLRRALDHAHVIEMSEDEWAPHDPEGRFAADWDEPDDVTSV